MADDKAENADDGTAPADVKDAFRQALERKKNRTHLHEETSQAEGSVHETQRVATGRRTHRRKSG
ncbi:MAG: DUF5302 domain-containing protein [Geodermatophilaceae bacterium]|nr:DUF5302 domain-containing protein [Geodermatophilaceae bacterium]MDQ3454908.1 DUF5302 domain-containing protein [Actinomycetota bacterium]